MIGKIVGVWEVISQVESIRYELYTATAWKCRCTICGSFRIRSSKALLHIPKKIECKCNRLVNQKTGLRRRYENGDERVGRCPDCGILFTKLTMWGAIFTKCITCRS